MSEAQSGATAPSETTGVAGVPLSERRLSDLNDHERASLAAALRDAEAQKRPLVSAYEPISSLRSEYAPQPSPSSSSSPFVQKIDWLERNGWRAIRRLRGDGDCGYRAFAFAYVERLIHDSPETAKRAYERVKARADSMSSAGFDKDITDEFFEPLLDLLKSLSPASSSDSQAQGGTKRPTAHDVLETFNDPTTSNYIVYALRLLTSSYLKSHADDFAPFLFALEDDPRFVERGEPPSLDEFCSSYVEAVNKEADHIQLTALTRALGIHMRVAYLDQSSSPSFAFDGTASGQPDGAADNQGRVDFHEFESEASESLECALLYRPGHYDILYKSQIEPTAEVQA